MNINSLSIGIISPEQYEVIRVTLLFKFYSLALHWWLAKSYASALELIYPLHMAHNGRSYAELGV